MESLRQLFRTGLGPSSCHTMGPARAARMFLERTAGAAKRLEKACGIIIMAYYATLVRQKANLMFDEVFQR